MPKKAYESTILLHATTTNGIQLTRIYRYLLLIRMRGDTESREYVMVSLITTLMQLRSIFVVKLCVFNWTIAN